MPVRRVNSQKPYYQYGTSGKKYYYTPNDSQSRKYAREMAIRQGKAIAISKYGK